MRAITAQGLEEIARFANTWSRKKSYQAIDQIMLYLLPPDEQKEPKLTAIYQTGGTSCIMR